MLSNLTVSEQLARETRSAVAQLGLTWDEIHARGGPSPATMTKLVKGDPVGLSLHTCRKLDSALGWQAGTARSLAQQADTPLELHGIGPATGRVVYRVTHESGITADAAPEDDVDLEALVEGMRDLVSRGSEILSRLDEMFAVQGGDRTPPG